MPSFDNFLIIGVDLAWSEDNYSTYCIVDGGLNLLKLSRFKALEEFLSVLCIYQNRILKVLIDAPLEVKNKTGIRPCDRVFLKNGIPILPVNKEILRQRYPRFPGLKLRNALEGVGIKYCGSVKESAFYEVYVYGVLKTIYEDFPPYKKKKGFVNLIEKLLRDYGFKFSYSLGDHHQVDAIVSTIPWFEFVKRDKRFTLYNDKGYCLFVPSLR